MPYDYRPISRQYRIFREEEKFATLPRTTYERTCRFFIRIINVEPDKKTKERLQKAIDFTHLRLNPNQVASLPMGIAFFISLPVLILIITKLFGYPGIAYGTGMMMLLLTIPLIYFLYNYPFHIKKLYEIDAGSEMVSFILYVSMYMRNVPNLEGAVKFAAENLAGNLGFEIRKLLWDVEVGNYLNIRDALLDYARKWEGNKEFVESVEILISSLDQPGERRLVMLNEAVDVMLTGSRDQARHFNQALKMPVMVVHALGIILPIMGLVLFPIISIFLGVQAIYLFVVYDIILPITLFFIINHIMEERPATFSKIDISDNPEVPPGGKFKLKGNILFDAWIVGVVIALIFFYLGINVYIVQGDQGVLAPLLLIGGVSLGFSSYYLLLAKDRTKVRNSVRRIESEFAVALFQLGNHISAGIPLEVSMERSIKKMENLTIKDLFVKSLRNMKNLGMTFPQSFFDSEYGAIRYYPSKTIKTVMRIVSESAKKGVSIVAEAMLSVSRYLKGIYATQEDVRESFSETVSSLKFQAYFLSPFISGIIVTMAMIIIQILNQLSEKLTASTATFGTTLLTQFNEINITPFQFIMVVGIYLIETAFILSMFVNGIESGEDLIGKYYLRGHILWASYVVFVIAALISLNIFSPLVLIGV